MPLVRPQFCQGLSHLRRAQSLRTAQFTYELPAERIATYPLPTRHDAKLLVVSRDQRSARDLKFSDLPSILPSSSLIVRNATRVIPARIPVFKASGGRAEVLLLHPSDNIEPEAALSATTAGQRWNVLLGGRNLHVGDVMSAELAEENSEPAVRLEATIIEKTPGVSASVSLNSQPVLPLRDILSRLGLPPLPPYIRRAANIEDRQTFQTVYARNDGSAAAPTAGLHVTADILKCLQKRGIQIADIVLHIGTATFRQVNADVAGGHIMHQESISVAAHVIDMLIHQVNEKKPIVALGTTSIRTIESLYWFGVRLMSHRWALDENLLYVDQWEPYRCMDQCNALLPDPGEALSAVREWCESRNRLVRGTTNLLILPGYPFMLTSALITNFHQPRSTLLMLVSAFYGGSCDDLRAVYQQAMDTNYRFLSYGDSSIYADANFYLR